MTERAADVLRWVRGQKLAARRIARERQQDTMDLGAALDRVDELRAFADSLGTRPHRARAQRENLSFHLTWSRLRQALGFG